MNKNSKIVENPSAKKIIEQMNAFDSLIPFLDDSVISDFLKLKEQAKILLVPDQFNKTFSEHGWIAYESMNFDVMKIAIDLYESEGLERAEEYLADSYNEETLKWGILRFNGNCDFRKRIRLAELAQDDYLSGRYHACVPLLLSLLDGLVNDVSKHVGFFAKNIKLTAWDCIAAHETGLQTLTSILTKGRNKTNENSISIPYRNGILHGRELAFDNKVVAAKCWVALFATRDWAGAPKKEPKPKEEVSLSEQIHKANLMKKSIEEWKPRISEEVSYLPFKGEICNLPENTPEWAVGTFLDHWCNKRFGPLADALLHFTDAPKGKRAGIARQNFGTYIPTSFKILAIDDQATAVTHVIAELHFEVDGQIKLKEVSVRAIYQDIENNLSARSMPNGRWRIVQNSFMWNKGTLPFE